VNVIRQGIALGRIDTLVIRGNVAELAERGCLREVAVEAVDGPVSTSVGRSAARRYAAV
jgi:hypothetical protein